MKHTDYMALAIDYAKKGCGFVNPNPMVGVVIVGDNQIIAMGYHRRYGEAHAERNALDTCTASPKGATMYVTLEPCCHHGKTPPCTEAIIKSGISKVVVGARDPNPLVSGKGIEQLRKQGIEIIEEVLTKECESLNEVFFHYVTTNTPFVLMKYAMTMDGKAATCSGDSKWITGEKARKRVQYDRHRYTAIMVGVGTVIKDDPQLTCRLDGCRSPIRVICDTNLRTPVSSQIVNTADDYKTIIATACADEEVIKPYTNAGCRIVTVQKKSGRIDLNDLMIKLGKEGVDSILLEGGGELNWSALQCGIVNKVQTYIAPKVFGGANAKSPVTGNGVNAPDDAYYLENSSITFLDNDILIESEVKFGKPVISHY